MKNIKHLLFEDRDVKGIAYADALEALDEAKLLDHVSAIDGTSAGAITSCLVALRYSASEIKQPVNSTNFKSFEDEWNPLGIPLKYGLYRGDTFL